MDGGSVKIRGGSGGCTGFGGDVTILSGNSAGYMDGCVLLEDEINIHKDGSYFEKEPEANLIKKNPCWPYMSRKLSASWGIEDHVDDTLEGMLVEMERKNTLSIADLPSHNHDVLTFSSGDGIYVPAVPALTVEIDSAREEIDRLNKTVQDLERRLSFLEQNQPWKDFV